MDAMPLEAGQAALVFRRSPPMRADLDRLVRAIGKTEGLTCLDIGLDNPMMSYHLRKIGGHWHTVVADPNEADLRAARTILKDNVHILKKGALPFKKKQFDLVVVTDMLDRMEDSEAFIAECHGVMKPNAKLVLTATNRKSLSLIRLLRRWLNPSRENGLSSHSGFTESELFAMFKNGFDLHSMNRYRRFFVESLNLIVQCLVRRKRPDMEQSRLRIHALSAPFFTMAAQLDMLLFFTRGHRLIAVAQRRAWLPRKTPVLSDGRTISEAVLSTIPQ